MDNFNFDCTDAGNSVPRSVDPRWRRSRPLSRLGKTRTSIRKAYLSGFPTQPTETLSRATICQFWSIKRLNLRHHYCTVSLANLVSGFVGNVRLCALAHRLDSWHISLYTALLGSRCPVCLHESSVLDSARSNGLPKSFANSAKFSKRFVSVLFYHPRGYTPGRLCAIASTASTV